MHEDQVRIHEQFVKNVNGTTISEIFLITLPSHFCTLLVVFFGFMFKNLSQTCSNKCVPITCKTFSTRKWFLFIKEICIIIVPMVTFSTFFAESSIFAMTVVVFTSCFFLILKNVFYSLKFSSDKLKIVLKTPVRDNKRSFTTCCRSIISVLTAVSILAVDFNIFPRRLAKTEKYGYSLMDVGVGFFILSNAAVVSVDKVARGGLKKTLTGCTVLFFLGVIRYFTLKNINYQNIIFEYGIHWNFFFTLSSIKLLSYIVLKLFGLHSFLPAVLLGLLHQILLLSGLEDYALGNKPRENWVDANREGLVSMLGYTSLYLIGVSMNKFVLKASTTLGDDLKTAVKLTVISALLLVFTVFLEGVFPVSRRIVSFTYITWVTSSALLHVAISIVVEVFLMCFVFSTGLISSYNHLTPIIYESINYNGLTFFLLANLLTGLTNILFNTMAMNTFQSFLILVTYMTVNCTIVFILYFKQIKLKVW